MLKNRLNLSFVFYFLKKFISKNKRFKNQTI